MECVLVAQGKADGEVDGPTGSMVPKQRCMPTRHLSGYVHRQRLRHGGGNGMIVHRRGQKQHENEGKE
jgi:hypothetical protein